MCSAPRALQTEVITIHQSTAIDLKWEATQCREPRALQAEVITIPLKASGVFMLHRAVYLMESIKCSAPSALQASGWSSPPPSASSCASAHSCSLACSPDVSFRSSTRPSGPYYANQTSELHAPQTERSWDTFHYSCR